MARLLLDEPAAVWTLSELPVILGRRTDCGVCLAFPSVSREHARIEKRGHDWWLQDLGSANGTLMNAVPVSGVHRLKNGDRIQVGKITLLFECEGVVAESTDDDLGNATILSQPENHKATLLVADLEGFTAMSAAMDSSELAQAVRSWCDGCRRILDEQGACLDKFIGDCVFAWWAGDGPEQRTKALQAAREILAIPSPSGCAPFRSGAALHCGEVALVRLPNNSHTILGNTVNTTFRMESLTRNVGRNLVVSAAFVEGYGTTEEQFITCGVHTVKGLVEPVEIFAPAD